MTSLFDILKAAKLGAAKDLFTSNFGRLVRDRLIPIDTSDLGWENGKYAFTTGAFSSATNRISTTVKLKLDVGTVLHMRVADGYNINYIGWAEGETAPSHYSSTWPTGPEVVVTTTVPEYCFMMRKSDNSNLGTEDYNKVLFYKEG